jgi:flavin reductase (DIM6/NTAB) family NADH-FMN oxidoreductase RutF
VSANPSELFNRLDREVWIVTAADGDRRGGLVATSVGQASIAPQAPRVIVGISRQHATWKLIESRRAFAAQLIAPDRFDLLERFGTRSSRDVDKFAGLTFELSANGSPILADALAWLDCCVEAGWDAGDRTFYLAEIVASSPFSAEARVMTTCAIAGAPEPLRRELRRQYDADAAHDFEAILRWRSTPDARERRPASEPRAQESVGPAASTSLT